MLMQQSFGYAPWRSWRKRLYPGPCTAATSVINNNLARYTE